MQGAIVDYTIDQLHVVCKIARFNAIKSEVDTSRVPETTTLVDVCGVARALITGCVLADSAVDMTEVDATGCLTTGALPGLVHDFALLAARAPDTEEASDTHTTHVFIEASSRLYRVRLSFGRGLSGGHLGATVGWRTALVAERVILAGLGL